jgi:hypothetical protein
MWIVFVKIAKLCAEHRDDYRKANNKEAGIAGEKRRPKWAEGL